MQGLCLCCSKAMTTSRTIEAATSTSPRRSNQINVEGSGQALAAVAYRLLQECGSSSNKIQRTHITITSIANYLHQLLRVYTCVAAGIQLYALLLEGQRSTRRQKSGVTGVSYGLSYKIVVYDINGNTNSLVQIHTRFSHDRW